MHAIVPFCTINHIFLTKTFTTSSIPTTVLPTHKGERNFFHQSPISSEYNKIRRKIKKQKKRKLNKVEKMSVLSQRDKSEYRANDWGQKQFCMHRCGFHIHSQVHIQITCKHALCLLVSDHSLHPAHWFFFGTI